MRTGASDGSQKGKGKVDAEEGKEKQGKSRTRRGPITNKVKNKNWKDQILKYKLDPWFFFFLFHLIRKSFMPSGKEPPFQGGGGERGGHLRFKDGKN